MRCGVAKICVVQCSHVVGYVNYVKDTLFIRTSTNQRLRARATTIEGQNAFAPTLCFA